MNKAQLVEALTTRIGDRRTAAAAVDGLVDVIVETVGSGGSVTLTGFGVFEPRRRAARVARNPRTGETVPVPETIVPSFRPGAAFRDQIGKSTEAARGATSAPRRSPRAGGAVAADAAPAPRASRSRAKAATAQKAAPKSATKAAPKGAAKAAPKTAAKATATKAAAKPAASKAAPKATAAKATPKTAAKAPAARKTAASGTGTAKTAAKAPAKRTTRGKA